MQKKKKKRTKQIKGRKKQVINKEVKQDELLNKTTLIDKDDDNED